MHKLSWGVRQMSSFRIISPSLNDNNNLSLVQVCSIPDLLKLLKSVSYYVQGPLLVDIPSSCWTNKIECVSCGSLFHPIHFFYKKKEEKKKKKVPFLSIPRCITSSQLGLFRRCTSILALQSCRSKSVVAIFESVLAEPVGCSLSTLIAAGLELEESSVVEVFWSAVAHDKHVSEFTSHGL